MKKTLLQETHVSHKPLPASWMKSFTTLPIFNACYWRIPPENTPEYSDFMWAVQLSIIFYFGQSWMYNHLWFNQTSSSHRTRRGVARKAHVRLNAVLILVNYVTSLSFIILSSKNVIVKPQMWLFYQNNTCLQIWSDFFWAGGSWLSLSYPIMHLLS